MCPECEAPHPYHHRPHPHPAQPSSAPPPLAPTPPPYPCPSSLTSTPRLHTSIHTQPPLRSTAYIQPHTHTHTTTRTHARLNHIVALFGSVSCAPRRFSSAHLSAPRSSSALLSVIVMTPMEVVASFEKHMEVEVKLGLATMVEATAKALPALLVRLQSLQPSMGEVTEVLAHLGTEGCLFSPEDRQTIGKAANAAMFDPRNHRPGWVKSVKTQQHLSLHHYLPAKFWACLESEDKKENKFRQLAQFMCQSLGLRNPDAKTKRLAVVIVHLASNEDPTPQRAYEDLHMFGDIVDQKRQSVCTRQTLTTFPDDPTVFMDAHPGAYGPDDPPVECRLSSCAVLHRCSKGVTPCRSSNQKVRRDPPTLGGPQSAHVASTPSDSVNGALLSILERYMFQKGGSQLAADLSSHRASCGGSPPVDSRLSPGRSHSSLEDASVVEADSSASGSSPAPMFSGGGVAPKCLDPCHDKLAHLKAKLACAAPGDGHPHIDDRDSDAVTPLPRLERKRPLDLATDGEDLEGADDAMPIVKKRPAVAPKDAPKAVPKSGASSKSSGGASRSIHEALLKKPAKVARPPQSESPTSHAGGRIYFSKPKSAYRVYLRAGDRIEKMVKAKAADKADMQHKFAICCALIENDKRPA